MAQGPGAGAAEQDLLAQLRERLVGYLQAAGIAHEPGGHGGLVATLPGTAKLRTTVALSLSDSGVVFDAFVCRAPDEHQLDVYRLLLARNARLAGVCFALDRLGDIYLVGHLPAAVLVPPATTEVTHAELDRILGTILEQSDGTFNTLVRLGFTTAIERERAWRASRGLDDANLRALLPDRAAQSDPGPRPNPPDGTAS